MINLSNKFEFYILTHHDDMKGYTKYQKWHGLGKSAISQESWEIGPFDGAHTSSY